MDTDLARLLDELAAGVPEKDLAAGEHHLRRELARLPAALRPKDDSWEPRRRELRRAAAILAARAGRSEELEGQLMADWHDGGSARPLVALLMATQEPAAASSVGRLALNSEDCVDRQAIEELLGASSEPPHGWAQALSELARAPSIEAWDELARFVPAEVYYQRVRGALRLLRGHGVDPVLLFRIATRIGTTPDAFELLESGLVPPEVVAQRGVGSPIQANWTALAAVAAQARGDRLGAVRYLKEAWANPDETGLVAATTHQVREAADPELLWLLDAAELPPPGRGP